MTAGPQHPSRYVFLDYLRACAAWLVVWDHFGDIAPREMGRVFGPADWLRAHVTGPLGVIQAFGWFGVALFFLISGFIISDRARVEDLRTFLVRRLLRIYPMLAIAVLLSAAFVANRADVSLPNVLLNLTLANYLVYPQVALLGVGWTLIIEIAFYGLTAVTQVARGSPHRIAFNLAAVAAVIWLRDDLGPSFSLVAFAVSYLPVLVMGQVLYWWLAARRLSAAWGLGYLAAAAGVFWWGVRAMHPEFAPMNNSYAVSLAYAVLLFVAAMHIRLPERPAVRFLSDTSYSVYLLHGIVGWRVLHALIPRGAPISVSILAAVAATVISAYVAHRLVDLPSQRLARRLTRRPGPAPVSSSPGPTGAGLAAGE